VIEVRDETVSHLESAKRKPFPELRYASLGINVFVIFRLSATNFSYGPITEAKYPFCVCTT